MGETVAGGLGKRLDPVAALNAAGFTSADLRRMQLVAEASLTDAEFEAMVKDRAADDTITERTARGIIRARK